MSVPAVTPQTPFEPVAAAERPALAVDGLEPWFRVRPSSPEELAEALRWAADQDIVVTPRGGGTHRGLGNVPERLDAVVDTTELSGLVEYEPADLTVTVQAGMRFGDLQALLTERGQMLALDPAAQPEATVGGIVASNRAGPGRFAFGTARDLVLGTRVANPDGTLTRAGGRVVKNVAGYDLNKLHVGAIGTLGVLVELSFKLAPLPLARGLVAAQIPTLATAQPFLDAMLHSPLAPTAVELLGPSAATVAGLASRPTVVVRLSGYPRAVERQGKDLRALVERHGGMALDVEEPTWEQVRGLPLAATGDLLVRAEGLVSRSAALADLLSEALAAFSPIVWAHAGSGIAYAACQASPQAVTVLLEARRRIEATFGEGAALVVERCPADLKAGLNVWGLPADPTALRLMRSLKSTLDPRRTLNRGRFVGGL